MSLSRRDSNSSQYSVPMAPSFTLSAPSREHRLRLEASYFA
jgi:hypothetical protein